MNNAFKKKISSDSATSREPLVSALPSPQKLLHVHGGVTGWKETYSGCYVYTVQVRGL